MRRLLPCIVLAVLTACGGGAPRPNPADTSLAGRWEIEITRRGQLPGKQKMVRGRLNLVAAPNSNCLPEEYLDDPDSPLCHTIAEGTFTIPLESLVRSHPHAGWEPEAMALANADGTITISIGGCCDRGEIIGHGRAAGADRITGRWYQQFLVDGPGGRFVLRRSK